MKNFFKKPEIQLVGLRVFGILFKFLIRSVAYFTLGVAVANFIFILGMMLEVNKYEDALSISNGIVFFLLIKPAIKKFLIGVFKNDGKYFVQSFYPFITFFSWLVSMNILIPQKASYIASGNVEPLVNRMSEASILGLGCFIMVILWEKLYFVIVSRMILNREALGIDKKLAEDNFGLTKLGSMMEGAFINPASVKNAQNLTIKEKYKNVVFIREFERHETLSNGLVQEVTSKEIELDKISKNIFFDIQYSVIFIKDWSVDILRINHLHPMWNNGLVRSIYMSPNEKVMKETSQKGDEVVENT